MTYPQLVQRYKMDTKGTGSFIESVLKQLHLAVKKKDWDKAELAYQMLGDLDTIHWLNLSALEDEEPDGIEYLCECKDNQCPEWRTRRDIEEAQ